MAKDKEFEDMVKANPGIFDDMDCRPGPSGLDEEYSDSLIPECVREKTLAVRRKRRAEAAAAREAAE